MLSKKQISSIFGHRRTLSLTSRHSYTLLVLFIFGNAFLLHTFVTINTGDKDSVNSVVTVVNDEEVVNQWRLTKSRQILDFREKEEFVWSRRKKRSVVDDGVKIIHTNKVNSMEGESGPSIGSDLWIDCDVLVHGDDALNGRRKEFVAAGWTKVVYRTNYNGRDVAIKQVNLNGHDATSCLSKEGQTPWECYRRLAAKIMKEIILLRELVHPNILKVHGFCIPSDDDDAGLFNGGLALITELGESVDIIRLLQSSWEDRLRIVLGVARLVNHLSHSPLGSIVMNDFRRQQFVLVDGELKLSDVDDMELDEPSCDINRQSICVSHHEAAELTFTVPCSAGRCVGHNEKQNIFHAGRHFVSFLLPHGAPQSLRQRVDAIVNAFANVTWDSDRLLRELEEVRRIFVSGEYLQRSLQFNANKMDSQTGFKRFQNSDLPGLHDYRCQFTVSGNGCILSVYDDEEAMDICRSDPDCRAFVIMSQQSWTGRHVTYFKSNFSAPVYKFGATLYVEDIV